MKVNGFGLVQHTRKKVVEEVPLIFYFELTPGKIVSIRNVRYFKGPMLIILIFTVATDSAALVARGGYFMA